MSDSAAPYVGPFTTEQDGEIWRVLDKHSEVIAVFDWDLLVTRRLRAQWLCNRLNATPSPSPSEGLTEEERQLLVGALNSAEQLMLNGDEYSRGRARDLVIGVRRKLDRLVSLALPADLAGLVDRITLAEVGSCSCNTKSHEIFVHTDTCGYRVLSEASTAITALSARVAELEAQATEYATRLDLLQFAANQADFKKRAAEAQASLARRLALEETLCACETVYDRHAAAAKVTPEFAWKASADHCCDAIRALSPTLDMDAMVERGARALYEKTPLEEGGEAIDGHQVSPNTIVTWQQIIEFEGYAEIAADFRGMARAVLSALLEGGE